MKFTYSVYELAARTVISELNKAGYMFVPGTGSVGKVRDLASMIEIWAQGNMERDTDQRPQLPCLCNEIVLTGGTTVLGTE